VVPVREVLAEAGLAGGAPARCQDLTVNPLATSFFKLLDLVLRVLIVCTNPSITNVHEPLYHITTFMQLTS